jgi:hypothetical protein
MPGGCFDVIFGTLYFLGKEGGGGIPGDRGLAIWEHSTNHQVVRRGKAIKLVQSGQSGSSQITMRWTAGG